MERNTTDSVHQLDGTEQLANFARRTAQLQADAQELKANIDPELGPAVGMIERSLGEAASMADYLSQRIKQSGE